MFEREELLHPMMSHFPIAMFFLALVAKSFGLAIKSYSKKLSKESLSLARSLIFLAPLLYMINLFLGDIALEKVKNSLCDITQAYQHEQLAETAMLWFIVPIVAEALSFIEWNNKLLLKKLCVSFGFLGLILGNFYMVKTAQLGSKLVYEQGAGVSRVLGECRQKQNRL